MKFGFQMIVLSLLSFEASALANQYSFFSPLSGENLISDSGEGFAGTCQLIYQTFSEDEDSLRFSVKCDTKNTLIATAEVRLDAPDDNSPLLSLAQVRGSLLDDPPPSSFPGSPAPRDQSIVLSGLLPDEAFFRDLIIRGRAWLVARGEQGVPLYAAQLGGGCDAVNLRQTCLLGNRFKVSVVKALYLFSPLPPIPFENVSASELDGDTAAFYPVGEQKPFVTVAIEDNCRWQDNFTLYINPLRVPSVAYTFEVRDLLSGLSKEFIVSERMSIQDAESFTACP